MSNSMIEGDYVCLNARACTNGLCRFRGNSHAGFVGSFYCSFGKKQVHCVEKKVF